MRAAAVMLILLGFASGVSAQSFSVQDDLEYSRGLIQRRMHDIAFSVLDRIVKSDASTGEKASAKLEIANVYKDEFARGLTFKERIAASDKADNAYMDFIKNFGDHPRIIDAKVEFAEFLVGLGRYRIRLQDETLQTGGDRAEAEKYRADALANLKKAADLFDELKLVIQSQDDERLKEEVLPLAEYYRAILYYFIGRAEVDETQRLSTFQEGINQLEEYIFANESNLRGFWGYLYKGLCHREFGEESQHDDALASFDGVLNAFKNTIDAGNGAWKNYSDALSDPGAKDLFESTYYRYAETLNRFGRYTEAIKAVDGMQKIYKDENIVYRNAGHQARLEQAEAYFLTGNVNKAIELVSEVSSLAGTSNRLVQFYCDGALAKYLDEVKDKTTLDGDIVYKAAKGSYAQDRYNDAIRHFNTVIQIDKNATERALDCWNFLARCYSRLGFEREAALAASTGAFKLKRFDEAVAFDMARKARSSYARIYRASKADADKERLTAHKDRMDKDFGGGGDANYDPGLQRMQEGKYDKAITLLAKVKTESDKYDLARGYVAFCKTQAAEKTYAKATKGRKSKKQRAEAKAAAEASYKDAVKTVDDYVQYTKDNAIVGNPTKQGLRRQALGIALLAKAAAQKGLEDWDAGLATIATLRKTEGISKDTEEKAAILEAQMLMGQEAWDQAEAKVVALEKNFPKATSNVVSLYGQLGAAWSDKADAFGKAKQRVKRLNAIKKAVDFRTRWLKGTSDAAPASIYHVGRDLYELNRFDEAKSYFKRILDTWGDVEKPRKKLASSIRLAKLYLARILVWQGKYLEAKPILEALHKKKKRNLGLLKEYASLLTGTIREVDGKFVYVPGRGAHKEDGIAGFKLWQRVAKMNLKKPGPDALKNVLEARFHENLVRWAQNRADLVKKSIKQLRTSYGPTLDKDPKNPREGYWQRRFAWLERNVARKPTQTPPPPPQPR